MDMEIEIPSTKWTKTIERDYRGRTVNVYTDEHGWKVVQQKRYAGPGGNPRFFYTDQPKIWYAIVDATGLQRADTASTVADAKRQVEHRREFDRRHRIAKGKDEWTNRSTKARSSGS
jgi:hypothetical protein